MTENLIFPATTGLQSSRDAGYKDTSMAIAELIDNSIEANAEHIRVLAFEETKYAGSRNTRQVSKIAVFDDGDGMPPEVLNICLGFAQGTRLNRREGMGRFGVGLPLASISQCQRVTVYSWQENGRVFSTYLDIPEVQEKNQQFTNTAKKDEIPDVISRYVKGMLGETGTVVVWEKCDRLDLKRPATLLKRMEKGFCRIYRHFLDDDDNYGKRRDIRLLSISGSEEIEETVLKPNDPLYLMTPNNLPGYEKEATHRRFNDVIKKDIEYAPGKRSQIEIYSSVMKREIGRWPRGREHKSIRTHYRSNVGISFVRAEREVDFGVFNYFDITDPTERYWGIEVRFKPVLDELFGVTNNKQHVHGVEYLDKEEKEDYTDDLFKEDYRLELRRILSQEIKGLITALKKEINRMAASKDEANDYGKINTPGLEESQQASGLLSGDKAKTKTAIEARKKTEKQKKKEREEIVRLNDPSLSEEQVKKGAEILKKLSVFVSASSWPGSGFISIEGAGDTAVVQLNRNHPFYDDLYMKIVKDRNSLEAQAFHLFLLAYVRAENEMYNDTDTLERMREKWGAQLKAFLIDLKNQ